MPAHYGYYHCEMTRVFDTELRKGLWMATLVRKFSKSQKVLSTVVIFGEENRNPLYILAWKIPWTEKPGELQSLGSQKSWTQLSDQT